MCEVVKNNLVMKPVDYDHEEQDTKEEEAEEEKA